MKSLVTLLLSIAVISSLVSGGTLASVKTATAASSSTPTNTKTPIKHVVVLFQENVSFDHYFGTYPNASKFTADPHTPRVNGLTAALLNNNPNGNYSINPIRLDKSQSFTCDMNHEYTAEQQAYHGGLVDKFVEYTGPTDPGCTDAAHKKLVMGYFDGNTVTGLWNYAQHFAMNDNFFNTIFGPSTPAALTLIAGNTVGGLPQINLMTMELRLVL